jgi:hypothetical protein
MAGVGPHGKAMIKQMPDDAAAKKAGPAKDHDKPPAIGDVSVHPPWHAPAVGLASIPLT